jgi:beta-lactamase regulating signal transducer with metallopeptidase domain
MAHEGAHIDRGDYLSGIAATMVRALWWWHPGAWICVSRLHLAAEIACDAQASGDDGRADYAGHLLDLAQTAGGRRVRYGWTLGATSRLRERVDALLDDGASAHRVGITLRIALVMAAIVATCAAAPIRFTFSRTTDIATGSGFPDDTSHEALHRLRHGH